MNKQDKYFLDKEKEIVQKMYQSSVRKLNIKSKFDFK
jgi:hypothetical protein